MRKENVWCGVCTCVIVFVCAVFVVCVFCMFELFVNHRCVCVCVYGGMWLCLCMCECGCGVCQQLFMNLVVCV